MDFHHLKYFVEVADKKSFSKAARTLHISQSAISRTIKALEEELGVVLFMRNAKAVELTDAGTIFLSHAKRVVFMFETFEDGPSKMNSSRNKVRSSSACPRSRAHRFLPTCWVPSNRNTRKSSWTSMNTVRKRLKSASQEGLIDLGIVCTQPKEKEFESFFLTQDPMNVIIHRDNILSKEKSIPLKKLANESLVLYRDDFNLHDEIIQDCKKIGFQPKIVFETSQRDLMIQTVVANLGVALLPSRISPEQGIEPAGLRIRRRPSPRRTGNHACPLRHLETGSLPVPCSPALA